MGFWGWLGLVPLFLILFGKSPKYGFYLSFLCGFIFFTTVFRWTFEIPGFKWIHHVILGLYLGFYFGLFGLVFNFIAKRRGMLSAVISAPFIWIALEYLRSNISFLSLPWNILAHTQYRYPLVIQFASFTGAYGISFLMVLVNAALALVVLIFFSKFRPVELQGMSKKAAVSVMVVTAGLTGLVLLHGYMTISKSIDGKALKMSVLQGNIDREKKGSPQEHAAFIMQKYEDLTKQASKDHPTLIVWPEASTPGFVLKNLALRKQIAALTNQTQSYFLIGSSEYPKFIKQQSPGKKQFGNTAIFFSPQGKILGQYLKIHLVPFGEEIPYEKTFPWPAFIVPEDKKSFEIAGKEHTIFKLNDFKFGAVICWEVVFPQLIRSFVNSGAQFMVNLTNEGWFGDSSAPYQMAAIVAFRAVENRVPFARAANTGISCFIDRYGRITGRVSHHNKDIFVEGHLTQIIKVSNERTFYTQYGDAFTWGCLIVSIGFLMLAFFRKIRVTSMVKPTK
jgi:apolipoprotein N-acyltransferase